MSHKITNIGVLGAGRSAGYLIEYLGRYCGQTGRKLRVYDVQFARLKSSFQVADSVELSMAQLDDPETLEGIVADLDLVVSLLPPNMHAGVAEVCLRHNCHLFTASYTSTQMQVLGEEAKKQGLLFMNELGLDPGIDHLSASRLFDLAKARALKIESFESHCGGLVALDDCKDNPWQYKFTWNPTNVVLAGQGGESVWKENGQEQRVDGTLVFARARTMEVPGLGSFDVYPNRNSLTYEALYGLEDSMTLLRGTLRRNGFCRAWDLLVRCGFTESSQVGGWPTVGAWFEALTGFENSKAWAMSLANDSQTTGLDQYVSFLRLEEGVAGLVVEDKTSAQILEAILLDRWSLGPQDKDEVVMVHKLGLCDENGVPQTWFSVLQVLGEGGDRTAMAKTVGLPLAMGVETFLEGEASGLGAVVPFDKSWYLPILHKLENQGIVFKEYL